MNALIDKLCSLLCRLRVLRLCKQEVKPKITTLYWEWLILLCSLHRNHYSETSGLLGIMFFTWLSCIDVEKSFLSVLFASFVHLCCDPGWGSLMYELAPPWRPCMPTTWVSPQCRQMTGRSWAVEVKDWCVCGRRGWGRSCGRCTTGGLLPSSESLRGLKKKKKNTWRETLKQDAFL